MIKIVKALYGPRSRTNYSAIDTTISADVTEIIRERCELNSIINIRSYLDVCPELLPDPCPGIYKVLSLIIKDGDKEFEVLIPEGEKFIYPHNEYKTENSLVLTSCNRIDQVCLAIAINKEIIKEDFNLVIADCSTPELDADSGLVLHGLDPEYNDHCVPTVNKFNYSSNYNIIDEYVKNIEKIKNYRLVHISPKLNKQVGEATLISHGLTSAALLGSKYTVKLSGTCILKYDIMSVLPRFLGECHLATWERKLMTGTISTRVFACKPQEVGKAIMSGGWYDFADDYNYIEHRFEKIIKKYMSSSYINNTAFVEDEIIVDEGLMPDVNQRALILSNLEKHNLMNSDDVWIKKFLNGEIWE
jgi:hypothetical protein